MKGFAMRKETNSAIPPGMKNNLNWRVFVLLCVCLSIACAVIVSAIIVPNIGSTVCGFVPVELVALCCAIGQLAGTISYIKKHKFVCGNNYEWYQVINSAIYGVQNVLKVLLVVALLNLFIVPVLVILMAIYGIIYIRKIFK